MKTHISQFNAGEALVLRFLGTQALVPVLALVPGLPFAGDRWIVSTCARSDR